MATEIICTACGELFSIEGDSVSLPFVCTGCEKKKEELATEAETAQLVADAEASKTDEEIVAAHIVNAAPDGCVCAPCEATNAVTNFALAAAEQTIGTLMDAIKIQAEQLDEAHQAEERSHKTVARLLRTLDRVAAERDQNADMAVHNMLEGIRAVSDLADLQEKYDAAIEVCGALESERNLAIEKYQTMKRNNVSLVSMNNHLADKVEAAEKEARMARLREQREESLLRVARMKADHYKGLYCSSLDRNVELVKENKELKAPWYRKLGRKWDKLIGLPDPASVLKQYNDLP